MQSQPTTAPVADKAAANDPRQRIDVATYRFLEGVWGAALHRAAEDTIAAPPYTPAQHTDTRPEEEEEEEEEEVLSADSTAPADATRLSPAPDAAAIASSSPLPRAPPRLAGQMVQPPPIMRPATQPVLQRRPAHPRPAWMQVVAQPNLKRNEYTAHRGVAWVVN